jgi:septal ring factor EnvC (AmiA/AmiB activator)
LGSALRRRNLLAVGLAGALLAALIVLVLTVAGAARAADAGGLEAKLTDAREEAGSIVAGLQESHERLALAEGDAAEAEAREQRLSALLAEGEERTAELSARLAATRHELAVERARLRRARGALAERLVAIYESGTPEPTDLIFGSGDFDQLVAQSNYLREIVEYDTALAERVAEVSDEVEREAGRVETLRARAAAYDERLAAARDGIASVREAAQAAAGQLQALSASREASLSELRGNIDAWVSELQEARAASEAEAEEEVGRWLGGPYSIPTYIVMCESGGDYGALNPSSGAGGAYQILPSTWELYGGKGEPQNASKAEQDRIAAEIWADSGSSAWVCG